MLRCFDSMCLCTEVQAAWRDRAACEAQPAAWRHADIQVTSVAVEGNKENIADMSPTIDFGRCPAGRRLKRESRFPPGCTTLCCTSLLVAVAGSTTPAGGQGRLRLQSPPCSPCNPEEKQLIRLEQRACRPQDRRQQEPPRGGTGTDGGRRWRGEIPAPLLLQRPTPALRSAGRI